MQGIVKDCLRCFFEHGKHNQTEYLLPDLHCLFLCLKFSTSCKVYHLAILVITCACLWCRWLSVGSDLKFDARRDLDDVGAMDVEGESALFSLAAHNLLRSYFRHIVNICMYKHKASYPHLQFSEESIDANNRRCGGLIDLHTSQNTSFVVFYRVPNYNSGL